VRIDVRELLRLPLPTMLLGGLNLAIVVGVVALAVSGTRSSELLATTARPQATLAIELASAPAPADLAAIQNQPLMHASRAFYTAPRDAAPVAPPLPAYRLAGCFISPTKPAVALLADPQGGATRRVHPGDELDGWHVASVDAKRVVLRWQEETREIGATSAPPSSGLKRVPILRQRMASTGTGVVPLGASGQNTSSSSSGFHAAPSDTPRLYRPPPTN
jgi:hypothetical protein